MQPQQTKLNVTLSGNLFLLSITIMCLESLCAYMKLDRGSMYGLGTETICFVYNNIYNWFPDVFKANSYQIRQFGLPNKLSSFITQVLLLAILHSVSTQRLCYTKIYMGLRECPCGVF